MESKANFAVVGAFVLLTVFAMVGFISYLSGKQFDETYDEYIVVYATPPRGVQVGSEVRYKEIKVGEVTRTELTEGAVEVNVYIRVKENTPIFKETFAQNEPLGLTGLSYIQLSKGDSLEPIEAPGFRQLPRIEGRASQFDELLGGSESIVDNANVLLASAINVMDPEAVNEFHGILANINTITAAIAKSDMSNERVEQFMSAIEQAAIDVSIASLALEQTSKDLSVFLSGDDINRVVLQAEATLKAAETTLIEFTKLANDGSALSDEAMHMVEQFTATGLQDLSLVISDMKTLIETLNRASEALERSPIDFITGQDKEITELPQ